MAISYANVQVTKVLTLRGNTIQNNRYTGLPGELTVDTEAKTIRIHNGVTPGGNVIQGASGAGSYANANVKVYLTAFDGNIIPSANSVYSLGSITNQWKDLFVSNNTIYVGGAPLSIDATGNLTVNGTVIPTIDYINAEVANVTVDLSAYALNANVTAANVGLKGYVDLANTIQSAQLTAANTAWAANASAQQTLIYNLQSSAYSNINVTAYLASHIDQTIGGNLTIQGNLTVNGNVTYISVNNIIIDDNIIQLANFNTADSLDLGVVAHRTPSGQPMQHTGLIRDASANQWRLFSNVVAPPGTTVDFTDAVYDDLQLGNIVIAGKSLNWANASIDQTSSLDLSITGDGQVSIRSLDGTYQWTFGTNGTTSFPNGTILAPAGEPITMQSDQYSQLMWENANVTVAPDMSVASNFYVAQNSATLDIVYRDGSSNQQQKSWLWNIDGMTLPEGGTIKEGGGLTGAIRLTPAGGANADQALLIYPTAGGEGDHIHLTSGGGTTELYLGNDNQYVKLVNGGDIDIRADDLAGNSHSWTFDTSGQIIFPDSTIQTTAADFGYLDLDKDTIKGTAGYQYTFATDGYFSGSTSSESPNYFFVTYNTINTNIASGWTVVGGTANTTVSNVTYPVPGYPGVIRVNLTVPAISTSGFYPVTVTSPDRLRVEIQPNPGTSDKFAFTTSGLTFPDSTVQTTAYTGYGNVQVGVFTNLSNYAYNANVTAANVGLKGYVDFANTIMKAYVDGQITAANANVGISSYSNVQVATYLPTYTGTLAGSTLNLAGQDGTTVVDFQTGAATNQIITLGSNYTFSIKAGDGASNRGSLVLESGRNSRVRVNGSGSNVLITAGNGTQSSTWIFSNSGVLTFPDGTTQSTAGGSGSNYSNVNVAAYLSTATINTTGNITAQNLTGNISITGNVTGTSANVTLQAGSFSSTFDNQGNVRLPTAYVSGNVTANYFIGNGALLTGIAASSNYSNVNVATYLPTYSGNIANIRLGPSGVLTFADGTTQATAGGGSYSNVQVAAYLTTGINTAAPQIQLTNATSNYIRYSNVGVGAPTFTTSNVGTRIIYWPSVDANTADYAVGIDAGVLWHGIPRATSGFAFKWYAGTTQIAVLEGTGSFTIANIRLSPSGNIVFPDGTVQTTAATGTYSNIQVATYLPTYTGSLNASNILVTSANITIANIQATTAATNPATGALRVMGGVGVAGAVVAGQLNSTGNVVANAISAYSLNTVANVVASVVNAGTINSAGNVLAQNLIGTIATASQTNITAVGTLATLSVTGNATVGNLVGTEANTRIIANVYTTTFDIYGNVTFPGNLTVPNSVTVGGNLTVTGTVSGGTIAATVYLLEAYASETYTLPGSFTEDPCRYSVVSSNVNVSSSWFNTSTYTFTPQKAGYWEITAAYDVYRNAEASLAIKKNNSIVATAGSFNAVAQQITKIIYLNGSTDSANVVNVGGAALSRSQYDSRSWFQARWIGA